MSNDKILYYSASVNKTDNIMNETVNRADYTNDIINTNNHYNFDNIILDTVNDILNEYNNLIEQITSVTSVNNVIHIDGWLTIKTALRSNNGSNTNESSAVLKYVDDNHYYDNGTINALRDNIKEEYLLN